MATITTDTYLDAASRTAGESWTCNGGKLMVRTDSRWHAGSTTTMTGSIGSVTVSATLGGGYEIDATAVRWMAYNTGSGTVPAIGTTITQGGVSGYLLGVWASYTSAPTAVGAAMPATGYLKFREVTGGPYSAGALTGISASAVSADVTGWIEVVHDQAANIVLPRLGSGFKSRGSWFYLDNTNGSRGQQIQIPTNNGGAGTLVPGCEIETSPGSGVYEWYPAMSLGWITGNLGTDERCKFVEAMAGGILRIGNNGTTDIGNLPASGCKVRIPNIIGRQCTTAARASNANPHATVGTRPEFNTTTGGAVDIEYFLTDWYCNFANAYSVRIRNLCVADILAMSNVASALDVDNGCNGILQTLANVMLNVQTCVVGGTFKNWKASRLDSVSSGYAINFINVNNVVMENINAYQIGYTRNSSGYALYVSLCTGISIDGCSVSNQLLRIADSTSCEFKNIDYVDRLVGTTNTTTAMWAFIVSQCKDILVDGITIGMNGLIADVHPYSGLAQSTQCFGGIRIRNAGTAAAPLSGGSANKLGSAYVSGGNELGVRVNRIYIDDTRTNPISIPVSSKNIIVENVKGGAAFSLLNSAIDSYSKGCGGLTLLGAQASVYGVHFADTFVSNTVGNVKFVANEPTSVTLPLVSLTLLGAGGFTSGGQCAMPTLGDELIIEMDYFAIGHTAFQNSAPVLVGTLTGNFTYEYQIDTGSGWSGTWLTVSGANLSAETITPSTGFKLKIRITTSIADPTNAITSVQMNTDSTLAAQSGNLYPMDYATISLTSMIAGSRVFIYDSTNSVELYNAVVAGTSLSFSTPYTADFNALIRIMKMSGVTAYEFYEFTIPVTLSGASRVIEQKLDEAYNANAIDGSAVTGIMIDDANLLVETDTGSISWAEIYAYETFWLFGEEGIRDEPRFITAIDSANYVLDSFKIKNVSFPSLPVEITGGWGRDSVTGQSVTLMDTTGGAIFSNPDLVISYGVDPTSISSAVWDESLSAHVIAGSSGEKMQKLLTTGKFLGLK